MNDKFSRLGKVEQEHSAVKQGFHVLAGPYKVDEVHMLQSIIGDMKRNFTQFCLVQPDLTKEEFCIYRQDWTSDKEFAVIAKENNWKIKF